MNRKAVSPVIGTMLMVAVVVILSAVVAGLVFGVVHKIKSTPYAKFVLSDAPSNINSSGGDLFVASMYGGDTLTCKDMKFQIVNVSTNTVYELVWNDTLKCFIYNWNSTSGKYEMYAYGNDIKDGFISVGDEITFNETTPLIKSGTIVELRVIHVPSNSVIYVGSVIVE